MIHSKWMERRTKFRIQESFPITVRGLNRDGEWFQIDTKLENLSVSGFYMRLPHDVGQGARLFAILELSAGRSGSVARLAVRGVVTRSIDEADGQYGVAVAIKQHRFV
jgi:PilZ domain